jgi:hypothetical protein
MSEAVQPAWKPERPLLLTQQQTALWLNISERTVRNLIGRRKLIPRFIGRKCLLLTADVEKLAKKGAATQGAK